MTGNPQSSRIALSRLLRNAGYVVCGYSTGAEFLAHPPTAAGCLVLDPLLPGPSGLNLQERLTTAENPLPIVFLTGHGDVPKSVRAMKAGAVDFLTKPVEAPVLLDAVARALARDAEKRAVRARQHEARARYSRLTPREREVLAHLISGQLNKQVGFDRKLPCQLQITYKSQPGQPVTRIVFHDWNATPTVSEATFKPAVPEGYRRIKIMRHATVEDKTVAKEQGGNDD